MITRKWRENLVKKRYPDLFIHLTEFINGKFGEQTIFPRRYYRFISAPRFFRYFTITATKLHF